MRLFVVVLVLVLVGCGANAPAMQTLAAETLGAGCARIDPSFNNIVVTGRWRDREVPILVDTGANQGSVAPAFAKGLAERPGERVHFAGASGEIKEAAAYDVEGLAIGNVTLAKFVAHGDAIADSTGYAFAIGMEHLAPYIVDFDLDGGWFCLRDRLPDQPALVPMTLQHQGKTDDKAITLDVTIGGVAVRSMILDTGAGISTINEELLPQLRYRRLGGKVESIDGSGVRKDEYFVEVDELCTLGACAPRHVLMPGEDLSPLVGYMQRGIVGVPFFRARRVILDFPRQRIGFIAHRG